LEHFPRLFVKAIPTMRNLSHLDDHECVSRAQQGDGSAFPELVARYQDRLYRFLVRLTRSEDDALELAQETFLHAYQGLARWRLDARFSTWLFQVGRNLAFDLLRRRNCVEFLPLDEDAAIADLAPGPDAVLETAQRYRMLELALARLPVDQREILLLREIEEMSYEDIAVVLGLNPGTVKSRLARGRAALLEKMPHRLEELS
jgi:RNA polymerase sigma factor (sigma-70 family)